MERFERCREALEDGGAVEIARQLFELDNVFSDVDPGVFAERQGRA